MTCIVGLVDDGVVYMGGDSAGLSGWSVTPRTDEKVFALNESILVGYTESFRMGQLIRFGMEDMKPPEDCGLLFRWMVTEFVAKARQVMAEGGFRKRENEVDRGGLFMVGARGHLFTVEHDFQVADLSRPFHAVGCGADFAMGSLFSTSGAPRERVRRALEAAAEMSAGVRGPFTILRLVA